MAQLVIGLTGSFGSGCSTVASILEQSFGFRRFSMSAPIREEWTRRSTEPPRREDLQRLGNELRQTHGSDYLAKVLDEKDGLGSAAKHAVVETIRNRAEIEYFRERYRGFYLIAVLCSQEERWKRIREEYVTKGLDQQDFFSDDARDYIQEEEYGQQVALCVDEADLVISNETSFESSLAARPAMAEKLAPYIKLLTGEDTSLPPETDEICMTIAYAQARRSFCLKRHVGAVITNDEGNIIATGFNENPVTMSPCYIEFRYCYKEAMMSRQLKGTRCPDCQTELPELQEPFRCSSCSSNLKLLYFPDKGMRWCTALHAEERALINAAGREIVGGTLYTTTFPCFNCARQISQAGIKRVFYVEAYPQLDVLPFLKRNKVEVSPFEGIKASVFDRLYSSFRSQMEQKYRLGGP